MTIEEFQSLSPDRGVERMLLAGRLQERPYEYRDRWHSSVAATLAYRLGDWNERAVRRGYVLAMTDCHLRRNPDTVLTFDAAYLAPERIAL